MSASAVLKLQAAGFTTAQVEALAAFLDQSAATRTDLLELEARLSARFDGRIDDVEKALSAKIDANARETADLRTAIAEMKAALIQWVVGLTIAAVGAVVAFDRLLG